MVTCDHLGQQGQPAVVLLHGSGVKDSFCKQYVALASRYHVVVPHLPGAGASVRHAYDPDEVVRGLREVVADLGDVPIAVVGHSLGAELALFLACSLPDRFSGVALLSPWVCPTQASIDRSCAFAPLAVAVMHCAPLVRLQGRFWGFNHEQREGLVRDASQLTVEQYRSYFQRPVLLREQPSYARLDVPLLAVCGRREVASMRASVRALARDNGRCEAVILPGCGHDYPLRNPDVLGPLLLGFLTRAFAGERRPSA